LVFLLVGVPTQIKIISDSCIEFAISDENFNLFCLVFLLINSSRPGSYIGIIFSFKFFIFFFIYTEQITLLPNSEKHVPETKPT